MKILSLFDGISCGRIALEKLGIEVEKYFASEIEPNAIRVAKANYQDTIEIGNICEVSYENGVLKTEKGNFEVDGIDLICGGSPCTNFSSIGFKNGMVSGNEKILTLEQYLRLKSSGAKFEGQSYLFWEYVRILKEVEPKYFLLENVVMAKEWEEIITKNTGVKPLRINSSLLSAQNRPRLYWTNIPGVFVPPDMEISLSDVLDPDADDSDVCHCLTVQKSFDSMVKKYGYIPERFNAYNASKIGEKACALSRGSMITSSCATLIFTRTDSGKHSVVEGMLDNRYPTYLVEGRYNVRKLSLLEQERLQIQRKPNCCA